MPTYVALLHSIVLGEGRRVVMSDLRAMAQDIGLTNPRTLVATGNLLFEARRTALPRLEASLEAAFARSFGRHVDIVVRDAAAWRRLVAANPYPLEAAADADKVGVRVMRVPLDEASFLALQRFIGPTERACVVAGDLWVHFGAGTQQTRLLSAASTKRSGIGTWRNWNTVRRLGDMATD